MKLIRVGKAGTERPAVLLADGTRREAAGFFHGGPGDWNEAFFSSGGLDELRRWVAAEGTGAPQVPADVRWAAPVARPGKIVCAGLNYRDHAAESGMALPGEPVLFMKASTAASGPNDDIVIPHGSLKTDWEVELAVVIGRRASQLDRDDVADVIAGYTILNDVSERGFQLERGGQWMKGKSCDTFAPLGPWVATREDVADPQNLNLWLRVNGRVRQQSHTSQMIFTVPYLIAYISRFMTLAPGDIVSTGTPHGVGMGLKPPEFLAPGDVVELGVDGLGEQRQRVVAGPMVAPL